ncbi:MAG TPA: ABC transporter permease [Gemmatimonadaceae bacterium]|nr:ABC transporter permease [Gemmatimonadaceae bacterium]
MGFDLRPRVKRAFRLALRRRDLTEAEVDEELHFHIASRTDQLIVRGLTREQALAEARRRFGLSWDDAVARVHEAGHAREERLDMTERLDAAWRDLAYAVRTLWRQPAFAIVVILTFGLGIGANATMFGVIDRLFLRPPPQVGAADELYELARYARLGGQEQLWQSFPYPFYTAVRADSAAYTQVAASTLVSTLTLDSGPRASQANTVFVSSNFFAVLETTPALGRVFTAAETGEAATADVAIVSHGFWQRRFGGDRAVLGKTLHLGTHVYTIVGVMREGFTGVYPRHVDLWLPLPDVGRFNLVPSAWPTHWGANWLVVHARLRPGVSPVAVGERASAVLAAGTGSWSGKTVAKGQRARFSVHPVMQAATPAGDPQARITRLLLAVSMVVLLVACANVAGLLLARGTERRREIAVRLALGVSRTRLMRLLVAETVVLVMCGGIVAVVVARWGLVLLQTTLLANFAWTESVFDARLLAAMVVMMLVAAALAGLAPAWRSSRPDVVASLKASGRAGGVALTRTRSALMVAQAALSVVLIVGAGLFVSSLRQAAKLELGYRRDRVIAATMDLIPSGYSRAAQIALYSDMRDRVAAISGVASVTLASTHPLQGWAFGTHVRVPGRDSLPEPPGGGPYLNAVGADYFQTLGLRIVEGRPITSADAVGDPVAVLSEAMAKAYWPGERAVGRCVVLGAGPDCTTVVGVAANAAEDVREDKPRFMIYLPLSERRTSSVNTLLARVDNADPEKLIEPIRRAMQGAAANLPYADVQTMEALFAPQTRPWRMGAVLFSVFGALALLIASVGLYSAISYAVTQRRHEFGVRMALGAQVPDVLRLVTGQGVRAAAIGVVLGISAALLSGRFVADLLFRTSARSPAIYVAVAALILAVASIAAVIPAWRASRVDPATALRAD